MRRLRLLARVARAEAPRPLVARIAAEERRVAVHEAGAGPRGLRHVQAAVNKGGLVAADAVAAGGAVKGGAEAAAVIDDLREGCVRGGGTR